MSVSRISNLSNNYYGMIASGKQINSAADNAAGLAIAEKLQSQSNGYDVGRNNAADGKNLLHTAEGGLNNIMDSLQRMRELSVKAGNATYSKSDLQAIQDEIDGLKSFIEDTANSTQFNGKDILNGEIGSLNLATNPDGRGMAVSTPNATLDSLGIADYDVTGNFDIRQLDKAIEKVSGALSDIGVNTNVLESRMNYNSYASYNLTGARSRIEDLDIAQAVSDKEKQRLLDEYQYFFLRKQTEQEQQKLRVLGF